MGKNNIEREFSNLGCSKNIEFIGEHIDYAPAYAVAEYVKGYLYDVLKDVDDDNYIESYLRDRGWVCKAPSN